MAQLLQLGISVKKGETYNWPEDKTWLVNKDIKKVGSYPSQGQYWKLTTYTPVPGKVADPPADTDLLGQIDALKKQIEAEMADDAQEDAAYEAKIKELTANLAAQESNYASQLQIKEAALQKALANDATDAATIKTLTSEVSAAKTQITTLQQEIAKLKGETPVEKPPVVEPPVPQEPEVPKPEKPKDPDIPSVQGIALPEPKINVAVAGYKYPNGSIDAPKNITGSVVAGTEPTLAVGGFIAGPDDSIALAGNLKGVKSIKVWAKGLTEPIDATIQKKNDRFATITLPSSLKYETYLIWAVADTGASNCWVVNRAELWWGQTRVVSGQKASIYGCNLAFDYKPGVNNAFVTYEPVAGGALLEAKVTYVDPYCIEYITPSGVIAGQKYKVFAHNGHGGKYGTSNSIDVTADTLVSYNGPVVPVTRKPGESDDSAALERAYQQANNIRGSVVETPEELVLGRETAVGGSTILMRPAPGKQTVIKASPTFTDRFLLMTIFPPEKLRFEKIKFDGNGKVGEKGMFMRSNKSCSYVNCDFNFPECNPFDLNDSYNTTFTNCKFTGQITFVGNARETFVDKCEWVLTKDSNTAIHGWACNGFAMTNSTCSDLDNSNVNDGYGWGQGRFFTGNNTWGPTKNTYLRDNTPIDLGVRMAVDAKGNYITVGTDPNSGEQFLIEGPICKGAGVAINPSADYKTFSLPKIEGMSEAHVYIIRGTGVGQFNKVKSYSGNTLILEEDWALLPDATSFFVVGHFSHQHAWFNNSPNGKPNSADPKNVTASAGAQFYGGSHKCIVDGLKAKNLRHGLASLTTNHYDPWHGSHEGMESSMWMYYLNCELTDCAYGIRHDLAVPTAGPVVGSAAQVGVTFRNIKITGSKGADQLFYGNVKAPGSVLNAIFEHCQFGKGNPENDQREGFSDTVYYKNS